MLDNHPIRLCIGTQGHARCRGSHPFLFLANSSLACLNLELVDRQGRGTSASWWRGFDQ
ncbi:hypothetical protein J3R74_004321 [Puniceicoccus vermicola]